jgi:hypothetical protein
MIPRFGEANRKLNMMFALANLYLADKHGLLPDSVRFANEKRELSTGNSAPQPWHYLFKPIARCCLNCCKGERRMRVVDAVWEQRNLGVTCYEISITGNDELGVIKSAYDGVEEQDYMVVKIASTNSPAVRFFQEQGYSFIETAITMIHRMRDFPLNEKLKALCEQCSWSMMQEADLEVLNRQIDKGIFKTDRVCLDPVFTKEQAQNRYKMWIKDVLDRGGEVYKVVYRGESIGFFCEPLAGVYDGYEEQGLGLCVQYAGLQNAVMHGKKIATTHISGNNPAVLRIMQSLGFQVKSIEYVFVKHPNAKAE